MTVYVDTLRYPHGRPGPAGQWCHLLADSDDELNEFAAALGLKLAWRQDGVPRGCRKPTQPPHYDLTSGMRAKAVAAGAVEATPAMIVDLIRAWRKRRAVWAGA